MSPKGKETKKNRPACLPTKSQKKAVEIGQQKPTAHTNGKNGH